jgi:hypothetical protein
VADKAGEPWIGLGEFDATRALPAPRAPRRAVGPMLGAFLAVSLGVLAGFGLLAVRSFPEAEEPEFRAMAVTMPVEVAAPQLPPPPVLSPAATPLEVLPPEPPPAPVARAAPPMVVRRPAAEPAPRADPDWNCRRPDSQSERLVCGDAELAGLNGGMTRAFDAAVKAGVPLKSLRQDQDDWLRVREDAARHEPQRVAGMYRERIAELKDIAASF